MKAASTALTADVKIAPNASLELTVKAVLTLPYAEPPWGPDFTADLYDLLEDRLGQFLLLTAIPFFEAEVERAAEKKEGRDE